jgi:hypothetical protein
MADGRKNALTEFVAIHSSFLLELNLACAAKEKAGEKITPPGLLLPVEEPTAFVTDDSYRGPQVN